MITLTQHQLLEWLTAFFWPLTRIVALFSIAPILGSNNVTVMTRIGLAAAITVVITPVIGPMPQVDPGSFSGLFILAEQIAIGIAMGLAMKIVFEGIDFAGNISGLQMGLGFATFYDPQSAASTPVIAQFLVNAASLIFLALNGHLMMIAALADSFSTLPVGASFIGSGWHALVVWGGKIFFAGLLLSMPLLAVMLITNIALGILTRAAPQLNIFAVGFPITLGIGFIMLTLLLPFFTPIFDSLMKSGIDMMELLPKLLH